MENNFEQNIRDTINDPPELPFEDRLWQDMESRLDHPGQSGSYLRYLGKLPLLLLTVLMTVLSGFFYTNQYKAMNKIAELERQIQKQQATKIDPSIEKHVTVIYDTIYNRVVFDRNTESAVQNTVNENVQFSAYQNRFNGATLMALNQGFRYTSIFAKRFSLLGNETGKEGLSNRYTLTVDERLRSGLGLGNEQRRLSAPEIIVLADSMTSVGLDFPLSDISTLNPPQIERTLQTNLPMLEIQKIRKKKKLAYYLHQVNPTRYMLSGTTGTFVSLNFGGNGFNLRSSVHFEVGIKDRLIWTSGIEYFSNDFNRQIKPDEEEPLEGFPDLPPNDEEDVLFEIQGDFNYLQVPFGVKYVVFPQRYFYPFIGFGLIAGKTTRSRLEYGYTSPLGDYAVSKGKLLPNTFDLSAYWSSVGFQVQLNRNWSLVMEGGAQFDMKKGNYKYEDLRILKLSTGFQYKF